MKLPVLKARNKSSDLPSHSLSAFGQQVEILHRGDACEVQQRVMELHETLELFLASRVLPKSAVMADINAGAGWFAVPFARAFPDWQVVCFEPDEENFHCLTQSVAHNGLQNVTCIRAGFHPEGARIDLSARGEGANLPGGLAKALTAPAPAMFRTLPGLGARLAPAGAAEGGDETEAPALAPEVLAALAPDLVRLDAPGCERALAEALRDAPTGFLTGQLYEHVPSQLLSPADAAQPREIYLPHGPHVLRRDYEDGFADRRPGLDVVVAMYNTRTYIRECVDSLLADGNEDITVLVVDDGSTDGCGDLVEQLYAGNPRVRLLRKANGGCASARNYGRLHSTASHITFVDADDRVDPGMFSALLEVARYTGFNMVEGEFVFFEVEQGQEQMKASYELEKYAQGPEFRLGDIEYISQSGLEIMEGQPTIWRRVYRRDFLDNKGIVFPEHVRAFDDQIFQLLSAYYCGDMAHVFKQSYHYRQHPDQDIKQGDERHFYSFNMFRQVFRRALRESWGNVIPVIQSLLNTMTWSYQGLRSDLKSTYQEAAVEFLAMIGQAFGPQVLQEVNLDRVGIEGLAFLVKLRLHEMRASPQEGRMVHLENWRWQPEFIRMMQAIKR